MAATDGDRSDHRDGQIVYAITDGNTHDTFLINPKTGDIVVGRFLDREGTSSYTLKIEVSNTIKVI